MAENNVVMDHVTEEVTQAVVEATPEVIAKAGTPINVVELVGALGITGIACFFVGRHFGKKAASAGAEAEAKPGLFSKLKKKGAEVAEAASETFEEVAENLEEE